MIAIKYMNKDLLLKMFLFEQKEEFHLYSIYCQNKLRSETLRNTIGDQNPFFMVSHDDFFTNSF